MCDFEEFLFACGHSVVKLKSYCHFARNHPAHKCPNVGVLKNSWIQEATLCESCYSRGRRFHNGTIVEPAQPAQQGGR